MPPTEPALHPPDFTTYNPQPQSPLFATLPPEIRTEIFTYALSPFEDKSNLYERDTYWSRPGYSAPLKTATELLRACRRVYAECWFMPFALAEHSFYLTSGARAPARGAWASNRRRLEGHLGLLHGVYAQREEKVRMGDVRVFAQMYLLEPGTLLQNVFDTRGLCPKRVHLTLRYTDFWHWEMNERLRIGGDWVRRVRFPDSVRSFVVDFESLERRKGEIDILVAAAVEKWVFKRKDGRVLAANRDDLETMKWTGSSMFERTRWIRDEVRPGELDYYVLTATWKLQPPSPDTVPADGTDMNIRVPHTYQQPAPPYLGRDTINEDDMDEAGVDMDTPAEQAVHAIDQAAAVAAEEAAAVSRRRRRHHPLSSIINGVGASLEDDDDVEGDD
ncbi:uncharacterized protein DSM5745_10646 [Aspergillus mulundensis]|uniref:Uncharacterized protein n=1 Tax=Aspergillus mulundensis TaxID=1810919 RepID=A0A3D8QHH2_9EURO|nr:Uncharacterized protein DSM5745_10646 [Aspergillus mulundensis]RDW61148.1 Uncharacterized protein DSM5745_10646 [Aspergillus mulundensis]